MWSHLAAMQAGFADQMAQGARLAAAARAAMSGADASAAGAADIDALRDALGASHEGTTPLVEWAETLGATVAPQLADVQQLADKIPVDAADDHGCRRRRPSRPASWPRRSNRSRGTWSSRPNRWRRSASSKVPARP